MPTAWTVSRTDVWPVLVVHTVMWLAVVGHAANGRLDEALVDRDPSHDQRQEDRLDLVRASAPPGVAIHAEVDAATGNVLADPGEVPQVVRNLCTNAVRALAEGGGTRTVGLRRPTPHGPLFLGVADDRPGMDGVTLAQALEPYVT